MPFAQNKLRNASCHLFLRLEIGQVKFWGLAGHLTQLVAKLGGGIIPQPFGSSRVRKVTCTPTVRDFSN